jgi:hypothetical protein
VIRLVALVGFWYRFLHGISNVFFHCGPNYRIWAAELVSVTMAW